jgi:taurine-pyruvate aminotransferase
MQTGKEHLDAVSGGVWTVNVGYGRERIANAVRDQLIKMNYFANSAGSIPGALFAEKLIEKMPGMSRVYYTNSGSEANEKAFKMVRQIAHKRYGGKKYKILYRDRDYHGSTIGAMSAGGQPSATRNTAPSRRASSRCRIASNTAPAGGTPARTTANAPPTQIEEVILREGPDTSARSALSRSPRAAASSPRRGLLAARAGDLPQVRHPAAYRRGRLRRRAAPANGSATSITG